MTVQTIPPIEDMTPTQRVELMEALWKEMSRKTENTKSPEWHREYLEERENALANGTDSFVGLDEFEDNLRKLIK